MSEEPLRLDAKRSALIIQDLQNDVISEGGAFADSGAPAHAKSQNVVENVKRLAEAARKAGTPVIHVHYLEPQPGDHVVEKMRMNGFYETRLDILLRGLGAETIVITGAWTNMSIEHTARHGADAGYEVVVVADGTSTTSDDWQRAGLEYAMTNVGQVASADEVIGALGVGAAA